MRFRLTHPRAAWLLLYVIVNAFSAYVIYDGNALLGESQELQLNDRDSVLPSLFIVISTYVGLLAFVFPLFSKLKLSRASNISVRPDSAVGITLFVLQVLFIVFFTMTGTFVAGSTERSDSPLSALWVIISVDSLFFIYYGFYRNSKLFWPNLLIAIVSNILRGWTGIFSILAFMESARLMRSGRLRTRLVATAFLAVTISFPIIQLVKLQTRFMASGLAQDASFLELAAETIRDMKLSDYVDMLGASGMQIVSRLHLVSTTIGVQQNQGFLTKGIESGNVAPYWKEGIYGIAFDRITGQAPLNNLGQALAASIDSSQNDEVSWNSNPGYFAWMYIEPESAPLYLLYTLGLLYACMYMVKKLNGGLQAHDMLWFACLSYLVPGWIASFVLFTNSLLLFLLFHRMFRAPRALTASETGGRPMLESPS
jgi:hypothetical protein